LTADAGLESNEFDPARVTTQARTVAASEGVLLKVHTHTHTQTNTHTHTHTHTCMCVCVVCVCVCVCVVLVNIICMYVCMCISRAGVTSDANALWGVACVRRQASGRCVGRFLRNIVCVRPCVRLYVRLCVREAVLLE
jgi:hypothetical protein